MSTTILPKQQLKNYCRRKKYSAPYFLLINEEKIDLQKFYTVRITIKDVLITDGRGLSRRIAEFKAALNALEMIGQHDPSVYDSNISKPNKVYGKYSLGRSLSVDHISRANRSDSIPSIISYSPGQYLNSSSACPSIDGIDSITETCDSAYGSETQNGYDPIPLRKTVGAGNDDDVFFPKLEIETNQLNGTNHHHHNHKHNNNNQIEEEDNELSESFDEGVCIESNESSSPKSASPSARSNSAAEQQTHTATETTKIDKSSLSPLPNVNQTQQAQSSLSSSSSSSPDIVDQPKTESTKPKSSSSTGFLKSFFLLNSLRAIHRRSFRRKSDKGSNKLSTTATTAKEFQCDQQQQQPTRPTSSSSAESTSSAFSSNSSITSTSQSSSSTSSASSTSGSFTLDDQIVTTTSSSIRDRFLSMEDNHLLHSSPMTNGGGGYSNLITQSIIEEDEEEEDEVDDVTKCSIPINKSVDQLDRYISNGEKDHAMFSRCAQSNRSIPRSLSTSYGLSATNLCSHNHFSIYGPMLCSNSHGSLRNISIKETPTAVLLRYCVRMYLPIPYYDIHFDDIFHVTCRVTISTSRSEMDKLPVTVPPQYKDREFTAKGSGPTLPIARNMAAEIIIEKLKNAKIYIE